MIFFLQTNFSCPCQTYGASAHESKNGGVFPCAMVKSRYIGDGYPTSNRNPYNGYINLYYWFDDHPIIWEIMGVDRPWQP